MSRRARFDGEYVLKVYTAEITVSSRQRKELIDITGQAREHVRRSGIRESKLTRHGSVARPPNDESRIVGGRKPKNSPQKEKEASSKLLTP